jgi:hypothetical protein
MLLRPQPSIFANVRSGSRLQLLLTLVAGTALLLFVGGSGMLLLRSTTTTTTPNTPSDTAVPQSVIDTPAFKAALCNPSLIEMRDRYECKTCPS